MRCSRLSAVSHEGATVAALAVHMVDALDTRRTRCSDALSRRAEHLLVVPGEAELAQRARGSGALRRQHPLAHPSDCTKRIFCSPSSAAFAGSRPCPRGECSPRCRAEPAVVVRRPTIPSKLYSR